MPSILSKDLSAKLLGSEWSFGYNCYEVGHTWTPSCTDAALELSTAALSNIMPLYGMLYTFSQVAIQQKFDLPSTLETLESVLKSSAFIFFHAYSGAVVGCFLRNSLGRFYYRVLVALPALLSSYMALLIEKPSRRLALAFYTLNLASEIVYRMAVSKGYFTPIKHGETLLFALSLSAWYHFIKKHGFGHDPVSFVFKNLIGRDEAASRAKLSQAHQDQQQQHADRKEAVSFWTKWIQKIDAILGINEMRHSSCPHSDCSCLMYVLGPAPSRFLLGYTIQSLLSLTRNPYSLLRDPSQVFLKSFTSRSSIRFGLFLMSLVSGGRVSSCLLRQLSQCDQSWHAPVSGFVAGLSMFWAPRASISMYIMWKAVEQYYLRAAKRKPYFAWSVLTIYALSASTILYTFALEPKYLRSSYMKFLDNVSNHRLHQLNRMVLDVFGTGSSVGYEDYFPDLDPRFMSNQFKELIFNWMIQPYE